eukprot:6309404-Prymnesium_polylepis.1
MAVDGHDVELHAEAQARLAAAAGALEAHGQRQRQQQLGQVVGQHPLRRVGVEGAPRLAEVLEVLARDELRVEVACARARGESSGGGRTRSE